MRYTTEFTQAKQAAKEITEWNKCRQFGDIIDTLMNTAESSNYEYWHDEKPDLQRFFLEIKVFYCQLYSLCLEPAAYGKSEIDSKKLHDLVETLFKEYTALDILDKMWDFYLVLVNSEQPKDEIYNIGFTIKVFCDGIMKLDKYYLEYPKETAVVNMSKYLKVVL